MFNLLNRFFSSITALVFALALTMLTISPSHAQVIGSLTDAPQHAFVAGFGVGPTSRDFAGVVGFAEKISSATGTYSYSGVSLVPHVLKTASGANSLSITPVVTTGVKQVLFQQNRLTLAADGGAGVSTPTAINPGWNFSAVSGVDLVWRLNKALNGNPGGSNNYIAIAPQFTQLTGAQGGTVVSLNLVWVHSMNGTN